MNVLADGLSGNNAGRGGFTLIPPTYLDWTQRSQMLMKALSQTGDGAESLPDIVALQEADHIDDFWTVQKELAARAQQRDELPVTMHQTAEVADRLLCSGNEGCSSSAGRLKRGGRRMKADFVV